MAQEKRACSLLCNKCIAYWFPSVDEDYKDHEHPREPACYRWTRFLSLCLVYLGIMYFIAIFILSFLDKPFIQMSRSQVNSIPTPVNSNYNINCSYVLFTGATIPCDDKLSNSTDLSIFVYDDPGTNFTDGTSMNMPIGLEFRISANTSFANDLSPAFITYPTIQLVDPDLFDNTNKHAANKLNDVL
ncbi:23884_t:CDS:2, partial [Gigaspora rosea]